MSKKTGKNATRLNAKVDNIAVNSLKRKEEHRVRESHSESTGAEGRVGRSAVPYITLIAGLTFLLESQPQITRVWIEQYPPMWLLDATTLVGVIAIWIFARALLVAQVRAVSLGQGFRDDKTVEELISFALARTGACSLWAVLAGLMSITFESPPVGVRMTDAIGTYATVGLIIGLIFCSMKSYSVNRSSLRLLREKRNKLSNKYWLHVQVVMASCDSLVFLAVVSIIRRFAGRGSPS
jgi:hypothetical protein